MLRGRDNSLVSVRDALLLQDAVAPIARAADRLHVAGTDCRSHGVHRVQRVRDEPANGKPALADTEEVVARKRELQPWVSSASLVFVALDEVPAANEVDGDVVDGGADDADRDIVPGHAAVVSFRELVLPPVLDLLEVEYAILGL